MLPKGEPRKILRFNLSYSLELLQIHVNLDEQLLFKVNSAQFFYIDFALLPPQRLLAEDSFIVRFQVTLK